MYSSSSDTHIIIHLCSLMLIFCCRWWGACGCVNSMADTLCTEHEVYMCFNDEVYIVRYEKQSKWKIMELTVSWMCNVMGTIQLTEARTANRLTQQFIGLDKHYERWIVCMRWRSINKFEILANVPNLSAVLFKNLNGNPFQKGTLTHSK